VVSEKKCAMVVSENAESTKLGMVKDPFAASLRTGKLIVGSAFCDRADEHIAGAACPRDGEGLGVGPRC